MTYASPPSSQSNSHIAVNRGFPIDQLAAPPQTPPTVKQIYNPPTPPPDDADSDAMDWTPTQEAFHAPSRHPPQVENPTIQAPSFSSYQRLPPAPKSQAAKLRNPPNTVPFFKASEEKQQGFFNRLTSRSSVFADDSTLEGDTDDVGRRELELAPPRFFPKPETRSDTGLENLFDTAFSLKDEPLEVQNARERRHSGPETMNSPEGGLPRTFTACIIGLALLAWKTASLDSPNALQLRLGAVSTSGAVAAVAFLRLLSHRASSSTSRDLQLILAAMELLISIALASSLVSDLGMSEQLIELVSSTLLGSMLVQEVWLLISESSSASPAPRRKVSSKISPPQPSQQSQPQSQSQAPVLVPPVAVTGTTTARCTRGVPKRESAAPSTSLSGLSLGDTPPPAPTPLRRSARRP